MPKIGRLAATVLAATVLAAVVLAAEAGSHAAGVVRFDFETGDLQGWQVVEGEFDYFVSDRPTYHNHPTVKYNKQGRYYLSTVEQQPGRSSNDRMTGVAESPVFVLTGAKMSLLVGGGDYPGAYVALCTLDGREVVQARGRRTEVMQRVQWSRPDLVGKQVFLRIVDRETRGWGHVTMDDFSAPGRIDEAATRGRAAARLEGKRKALLVSLRAAAAPLRSAVTDLIETFAARYPRGRDFLARIDRLEARAAAASAGDVDKLQRDLDALRREALLANPLVRDRPILFVVRQQYRSHYHAIDTLFASDEHNADRGRPHKELFDPGGAMKTIDLARGGKVTPLVEAPEGVVRDPDVHFDGRRIVFALRRNREDDYHIHVVRADPPGQAGPGGRGPRQLTRAEHVVDFDPIWMPDDTIVFSSTREPKYNMCSRDLAANLFRMAADGANIHQITRNTLFDNHAALLGDGRVLYARWEYVDRNFGDAHGLWTVNPDGTNQAVFWGNNTASPGAVFNAQAIPGRHEIVCILGMHHHRLWGALAILDPTLGVDGRPPVLRTWPAEAAGRVRTGGRFDCDGFVDLYPKYADPCPLSDPETGAGAGRYFLCSRMTYGRGNPRRRGDAKHGEEMGIYLVDVFGNEVLVHVEAPGCYDPMPVGPRPRPPVLAPRRRFGGGEGLLYVADVYEGTHMRGVRRGAVQRLRVVESPEKRFWSKGSWNAQGYTAPGMNWHSLENKRILGSVPVEADGSAYFAVPAEKFVFFQLLDADGMMIQSMRSGTVLQPGERVGCVGCHEDRLSAGLNRSRMAWRRPPRRLEPWRGPPREFSYIAEVQPVFNRHCVRCHDYGKKAGRKLNLAPDRTLAFNTSYNELWRKRYVKCIGGGPAEVQPAYSWGARASRIVQVIRKAHNDVKLTAEEFDRLVTWLDLNGVYYPFYASAYPDSLTGRCPLNARQVSRLSQLTGVPLQRTRSYGGNLGPQVSFDRPALSPCLARLKDKSDPKYTEALAIIEAGKALLAKRPRADMPGFVPCEADRRRQAKYALRRRAEARSRQAIREGRKVYDEPPG